MIGITAFLLDNIIGIALEKSVSIFEEKIKVKDKNIRKDLREGLSLHIKKVNSFSENLSTFKIPDTNELLLNSIELKFNKQKNFFRSNKGELSSELELLTLDKNIMLLGDVGAGKTTTIKRLIRKFFELLLSEENYTFKYSLPIIVQIGDISKKSSLFTHICDELGISYNTIDKNKKIEYTIGNYPIEIGLSNYLNELPCILFLDGLDEVKDKIKNKIFSEIKILSKKLDKAKMILSSRYIEEISSFKQFVRFEISPLDESNKLLITSKWLKNPTIFINKLEKLPYYDLTNRPLFLTYIILLYKDNKNQLPSKSVDIYRQIILLVIREWDLDKELNIKRYSKYKTFDTYKKEDFLSELAYELSQTCDVKKVFEHSQLETAYKNIYERYPELTLEDSRGIIKDIESLNGLIIEKSVDIFEFSHLSLQEYLCAKYIVSSPFSKNQIELFNKFPSSLAIANVLSPRPEEWFSMLFLTHMNISYTDSKFKLKRVYDFFDRLLTEQIIFPKPAKEIGLSLIYLKSNFNSPELQDLINKFSELKNIKESLNLAKIYFRIRMEGDIIILKRNNIVLKSNLPIANFKNKKFEFHKKYYWY